MTTNKSKYKTKQRDLLLSYLRTVPGTHVTAGDVCSYFAKRGVSIGQSTVYRQLEMLVDEGELSKYTIDSTSPACFEYIDKAAHCGAEVCYHCKCEVCGKLFHVHCTAVHELGDHLLEHHGFMLDPRRTVFYGLCENCRAGKNAVNGANPESVNRANRESVNLADRKTSGAASVMAANTGESCCQPLHAHTCSVTDGENAL